MGFTHYDLGHVNRGSLVEVSLSGSAANVRLLDSSNFQSYRSGRRHKYYGGLMRRSPARIPVPHSGHWHIAVDMQGLRGTTSSSIRIIPAEALVPLPEYSPRPLAPLVQPVSTATDKASSAPAPARAYDVFISHASEDKDDLVRPLANALIAEDLKVWYDEFELRIGDSLRRNIDHGLVNSRFGLVILSPSFFEKNWPQYELDGLVTREISGEQVILPVWHRITKAEVMAHSPSLADKIARNTSDFTIEEIAAEIADVIRNHG